MISVDDDMLASEAHAHKAGVHRDVRRAPFRELVRKKTKERQRHRWFIFGPLCLSPHRMECTPWDNAGAVDLSRVEFVVVLSFVAGDGAARGVYAVLERSVDCNTLTDKLATLSSSATAPPQMNAGDCGASCNESFKL